MMSSKKGKGFSERRITAQTREIKLLGLTRRDRLAGNKQVQKTAECRCHEDKVI